MSTEVSEYYYSLNEYGTTLMTSVWPGFIKASGISIVNFVAFITEKFKKKLFINWSNFRNWDAKRATSSFNKIYLKYLRHCVLLLTYIFKFIRQLIFSAINSALELLRLCSVWNRIDIYADTDDIYNVQSTKSTKIYEYFYLWRVTISTSIFTSPCLVIIARQLSLSCRLALLQQQLLLHFDDQG